MTILERTISSPFSLFLVLTTVLLFTACETDSASYLDEQKYITAANEYARKLDNITENDSAEEHFYLLNQLVYSRLMLYDTAVHSYLQAAHQLKRSIDSSSLAYADFLFNQGRYLFLKKQMYEALTVLHNAKNIYQKLGASKGLRMGQTLSTIALIQYERFPLEDSLHYYAEQVYQHFESQETLKPFAAEAYLVKAAASLYQRSHQSGKIYCDKGLRLLNSLTEEQEVLKARLMLLKASMLKKSADMSLSQDQKKSQYIVADSLLELSKKLLKKQQSSYWQEAQRDQIIVGSRYKDKAVILKQVADLEFVLAKEEDHYFFPDRLKAYLHYKMLQGDSSLFYYSRFLDQLLKHKEPLLELINEAYYVKGELLTKQKKYQFVLDNIKERQMNMGCFDDIGFYDREGALQEMNNWSTACLNALVDYAITLYLLYEQEHEERYLYEAEMYFKLLDQVWANSIIDRGQDAILTHFKRIGAKLTTNAMQVNLELWHKTSSLKYLNKVFHFAESMKSYLFLQEYYSSRSQTDNSIRFIQSEIDKINTIESYRKLDEKEQDERLLLQRKREQRWQEWRSDSLAFIKTDLQERSDLNSIRSQLKRGQAILHFTRKNESLFCFFIQKEQLKTYSIDINDDLSKQLNTYRTLLQDYSLLTPAKILEYQVVAHSLYTLLLAEVDPYLDQVTDLVVIADAPLQGLPFEALLRSATEESQDIKNWPFLLKDMAVRYAPSFKVFNERERDRKKIEYPLKTAIWTADELKQNFDALHQTIDSLNTPLCQLYNDRPSSHFLKHANAYELIHLSMHAESGLNNTLANAIYFAPQDTLWSFDIAKTEMNVLLLVLAACETSTGQYHLGEGVFSLVRSFQQAGVQQIVSSLWKIPQKTTSKILTAFYENMAKGLEPSMALQQAKYQFLKDATEQRFAYPSFWAGIVIY